MGEGQLWLAGHSPTQVLSVHACCPFVLLLLLSAGTLALPITDMAPCPPHCQCSGNTILTHHLTAVCSHSHLTQLPDNLSLSLTSLHLQGNDFNIMPNLSLLADLQFLDLSNNSLVEVGAEDLSNISRLSVLNLSGNAIDRVEEGAFGNLVSLDTLNLACNRLSSLSSGVLLGLDHVQVLNVSRNVISNVSSDTFVYLQRLTVLDLSHNQLHSLPSDALRGLKSLHTLLLHHNHLHSVSNLFHRLSHLASVSLSYNQLDALENRTFVDVPHLTSLCLSFNNISTIATSFFSGTSRLEQLDLRGNVLTVLSADVFTSVPSVQVLDLSQLPYLEWISSRALHGLDSLSFLNLSCNPRLSFLHPHLLASLPQLSSLDLRANNLSGLSHVTLQSNSHLQALYLANNPLHCDCGLAWMLPFASNLSAVAQDSVNNLSVVTDIDIVTCSLQPHTPTIPLLQLSPSMVQCSNVSLVNVTLKASARIGSQCLLTCDYDADSSGVLTWTTPRGLLFHYHPHPHNTLDPLPQPHTAHNLSLPFHHHHNWHSHGSYDPSLRFNSDHVTLLEDGSLLIDFVLRTDAGPYTCTVHNPQHRATATIILTLDYSILFEVKLMSLVVGLACAASFLALNTVYVIIMWGARRLVNKRRRERIHKLLESLDEYRTSQINRIRSNYSYQLNRIRDHYHGQSLRLKENYATQMKRVRRGCSNQVDRIRDNYHTRLTHLKEYSSHQIQQIRDVTNNQIIRIRDYGSLQMDRLRETYKLQQQHVLKVMEAMNLENCRTVVETECMRTESMIFDVDLPDLDDESSSEAMSQHSHNDSIYVTALNSDNSSQDSLPSILDHREDHSLTDHTVVEVLPSDLPSDLSSELSADLPIDLPSYLPTSDLPTSDSPSQSHPTDNGTLHSTQSQASYVSEVRVKKSGSGPCEDLKETII